MSDEADKQFNKFMKMIDQLQEGFDNLSDHVDDMAGDCDPEKILK
jgi:hypothetical protein